MKKIITLALVALFTINAQAQIKFGIKAGANLTSMSLSNEVLNTENHTGYFVGPTVKFDVPVLPLSFDLAALYDYREAKITAEGVNMVVEPATIKHQNIAIPLNVRWNIIPVTGNTFNLFVYAGPQIAFNLGDDTIDKEAWKDWSMKSSQLSANIGVGVMLMKHLQVNANYNIALGKTSEATDVTSTIQNALLGDAKANAWQIGVAYWF